MKISGRLWKARIFVFGVMPVLMLGYQNCSSIEVREPQQPTPKASNWSSSASYYKMTGYSCPQTHATYQAVGSWKMKKTKVVLNYKAFKTVGKEKIPDVASQSREHWIEGYKFDSDCETVAKSQLNFKNEMYVGYSCERVDEPVNHCSVKDSNCLIGSQVARTLTQAGDYSSWKGCQAMIQEKDATLIAGSEVCRLTGHVVSSEANWAACVPVVSATRTTSSGINEDLSMVDVCEAKVKSLGGYVAPGYNAVCRTLKIQPDEARPKQEASVQASGSVLQTASHEL